MRKLVIFIGGLKFGGMERVAFIAAELLKDIYDVTIVTLYQSDAEYQRLENSFDLNVPPKKGKINYIYVALKRLLRTKEMKKVLKPDIVWSFGMYSNYMNALTKGKEKIVMGIRSYDWLTNPFLNKKTDSFVVSKFDSVNAVSKLIAEDVGKYWKIKKGLCSVIYNPYDVNLIQHKSYEQVDDYIFDENSFYFISMGRLSYQKAFNHLIKSFSLIHQKNINTKLLILGNGELKEPLMKLIQDLNLEESVLMIGGKQNPYKYIKKCHAYVLSSLSEGFPNALVEAMALEIPIVATDCDSGPREILAPNTPLHKKCTEPVKEKYGILVPPVTANNDYKDTQIEKCDIELAKGMEMMLDEQIREYYAALSIECVKQFNYSFFKDSMLRELENLYL